MKFSAPLAATALALTALSAPVQAATLDVSQVNASSVFADANGGNKWFVGTSFTVGTTAINNVGAGVFRVKGEDENGFLSDFLAFCLEPLEHLTLPKIHTIENPFAADVSEALQTLASNAWALVTDSVSAGAFQMAVWEITTETEAYNIQDGTFAITGNGGQSNAAESLAQMWLDDISDGTWTASGDDFQILTASGTQDLLTNVQTPAPVPLPASGLLLLGGLAGCGFMAQRRKS